MKELVVAIIVVLALIAAVSLGFFYWQAHNSPLRRRRLLFDHHFRSHLRSIPVGELDRFPGIGPGTVDRVRAAGGRTLDDLTNFPFERLPGIGRVKGRDLRNAVATLVREARSRFDAGACPEAQEYRRELAALEADDREPSRRVPPRVAQPPAVPVPVGAQAIARPVRGPNSEPTADPIPVPPSQIREEHPWLPKLRSYVQFGFLIAKADGRIAQAEKRILRQFLGDRFGHDGVLLRQIDPCMEAAEKALFDESAVLADLCRVTTATEQRELFALAERITGASGEQNERERRALDRIAQAFELKPGERGASAHQCEPRRDSASPAVSGTSLEGSHRGADAPRSPVAPDPRTVLEIDAATELSAELIRRRYMLLAEKLDPTRAAALGPEFAAMAERKRADLRRAAESLIAPFGVPLDPPVAPPAPADLRHNPDLDDVFGG